MYDDHDEVILANICIANFSKFEHECNLWVIDSAYLLPILDLE